MQRNKKYIYINYNINLFQYIILNYIIFNYICFNILKNNYYKYNNISHIL